MKNVDRNCGDFCFQKLFTTLKYCVAGHIQIQIRDQRACQEKQEGQWKQQQRQKQRKGKDKGGRDGWGCPWFVNQMDSQVSFSKSDLVIFERMWSNYHFLVLGLHQNQDEMFSCKFIGATLPHLYSFVLCQVGWCRKQIVRRTKSSSQWPPATASREVTSTERSQSTRSAFPSPASHFAIRDFLFPTGS